MQYVAVYGTLRDGQHNNVLLSGCEHLGRGTVTGNYTMIDTGWGFPAVVENMFSLLEEKNTILCDVYVVDPSTLRQLDRLEGVATGLYRRESVTITLDRDRPSLFGNMYVWGSQKLPHLNYVAKGDWVSYVESKIEQD